MRTASAQGARDHGARVPRCQGARGPRMPRSRLIRTPAPSALARWHLSTLAPCTQALACYAGSSFAYFASSFLTPTLLNRTVTLKSSLCSSTAITLPTPNCACLTRIPARTSPAA